MWQLGQPVSHCARLRQDCASFRSAGLGPWSGAPGGCSQSAVRSPCLSAAPEEGGTTMGLGAEPCPHTVSQPPFSELGLAPASLLLELQPLPKHQLWEA